MDEVRSDFLTDINSFLIESKSYLNSVLYNLNWSGCHLYSNDKTVNSSTLKDVSDSVTENSNSNKTAAVKDEIKINDCFSDLIVDFPPKAVKKDETLLDILARERDLKRRRVSYKGKIHTKHKSHYEILRGVIAQQMEILEEPLLVQSTSSNLKDETRTAHNGSDQNKMMDFSSMHVDNPHTAWKYAIRELKHKEKERERRSDIPKYMNNSDSNDRHRSDSRARKRSNSSERKHSKSRERKHSNSRERKRTKSRERKRSKSRERKPSNSRERNRSQSRERKPSNSRERNRSQIRDKYHSNSREDHNNKYDKCNERDKNSKKDKIFNPKRYEEKNNSSIEGKYKYHFKTKDSSKDHQRSYSKHSRNDNDTDLKINLNRDDLHESIEKQLKKVHCSDKLSNSKTDKYNNKNYSKSSPKSSSLIQSKSSEQDKDISGTHDDRTYNFNQKSVEHIDDHIGESSKSFRENINSQKNGSKVYHKEVESVRKRPKQDCIGDNYKYSDFQLRPSNLTSSDKIVDENNRKLSISENLEVDAFSDILNGSYGTNKIYLKRNEFISKNSSENIHKKVNYLIDKDAYNEDIFRSNNKQDIIGENNSKIICKNTDDRTYNRINEDKPMVQCNRVLNKESFRDSHDKLSNKDLLVIKNVKDSSSRFYKDPLESFEKDEYHRMKTHHHQFKKRKEADDHRKRRKDGHDNSLNVESDLTNSYIFKDNDRISFDSLSSESDISSNFKSSSSGESATDRSKRRKRQKRLKKCKKRKGEDKHAKKKKRNRSKERKRKRK